MKKLYPKYIKNSIVFISFFLLMACKTAVPKNNYSGNIISFQELITNSHSNFTQQKNIIIDSPELLEEIFATINSTRKPGIPIPKIDFEKERIAFINIGQTSTGGHSVAVTKIVDMEDKVVIYFQGKGPKAGENVATVITSPFTMVKFEKQSKPVVFEWILN